MSVETVRPAGAGHETLYVLLGSVLILAPRRHGGRAAPAVP